MEQQRKIVPPSYFLGALILMAARTFNVAHPVVPIPIFALIIDRDFVQGEERFLEEIFGEGYREYRRRVRRWL